MNLNQIPALVLGTLGIAAACTLTALHAVTGGEALSVVTLVLGGGAAVSGVHAGLTAVDNGAAGSAATPDVNPRQQVQ